MSNRVTHASQIRDRMRNMGGRWTGRQRKRFQRTCAHCARAQTDFLPPLLDRLALFVETWRMNLSPDSIDVIERKLDQLLSVMNSLRAENETLRARVGALESEKTALDRTIDVTRERLEALRDRLPTP